MKNSLVQTNSKLNSKPMITSTNSVDDVKILSFSFKPKSRENS